jgi:hypothetical protein
MASSSLCAVFGQIWQSKDTLWVNGDVHVRRESRQALKRTQCFRPDGFCAPHEDLPWSGADFLQLLPLQAAIGVRDELGCGSGKRPNIPR